ncbi:MAG TPA: hypothetical protein VFK13_10155 [Gemmatimonadaceae bacterium]|nr:hypothetical protein [Gemmatimonadaceae bacterium]
MTRTSKRRTRAIFSLGHAPERAAATRAIAAIIVVVAAACAPPAPKGRGAGLPLAALTPAAQAGAYTAALRTDFDLGPDLVLLLDTTYLPTAHDTAAPPPVPVHVARALQEVGTTQGTCAPQRSARRVHAPAPICDAQRAGYIIRVTPPFRLGTDSVRLFLRLERYRPSADTMANIGPLQMEHRYDVVRHGGAWSVAHKARLMER